MADEEKGLKDKVLDFLLDAASFGLKAKNEAEKEEKKDGGEEPKKEEKPAENEGIDKREEMGDIGGFLKSKGLDDEDIRHVYKIMEKLSYDKSETGAADNAKNKCKNEDGGAEDGKKEEKFKEFKEEIDKAAENEKAKNSIDDIKNAFYDGGTDAVKPSYVTQEERIQRGMKY